jgi:hypothetical protein
MSVLLSPHILTFSFCPILAEFPVDYYWYCGWAIFKNEIVAEIPHKGYPQMQCPSRLQGWVARFALVFCIMGAGFLSSYSTSTSPTTEPGKVKVICFRPLHSACLLLSFLYRSGTINSNRVEKVHKG